FAPGAGAPTGSRAGFGFCCRSTASVRTANEAGTDLRLGQALIRTRGGCSYRSGAGFGFVVGAPPPVRTANEAGTDLRPGQAPFAPGAGAPTGSRVVLVLL